MATITRDITEQELREYAEKQAETIVIRSYDERGNSNDERRASTEAEKRILSSIIYGGLLAIRSGAVEITRPGEYKQALGRERCGIVQEDYSCT
mgnify:CR=1 FL=1